jgi:hypothetical protein
MFFIALNIIFDTRIETTSYKNLTTKTRINYFLRQVKNILHLDSTGVEHWTRNLKMVGSNRADDTCRKMEKNINQKLD